MSNLHISISAEPVAHIGSFTITNAMLTSLLATSLIILFAVAANKSLKKSGKPSLFQSLVEVIVEGLHGLVTGIAGEGRKAMLFGPVIASFFFFILFNNWIGLVPGVGTIGIREAAEANVAVVKTVQAQDDAEIPQTTPAVEENATEKAETTEKKSEFIPLFRAATADLNTTIALALISVALTQVFGFMFQKFGYFTKFINIKSPIGFFLGILELVLEIAKVASFAFRLFGNVFAGEVLISVIMFLIPVILPMPFYGLELFVGFIQALVFSLLSLVFFNMATVGHDEEH